MAPTNQAVSPDPTASDQLHAFVVAFVIILGVVFGVFLLACVVRRSYHRSQRQQKTADDRLALLRREQALAARAAAANNAHASVHYDPVNIWAGKHTKFGESGPIVEEVEVSAFDMDICAACLGPLDDAYATNMNVAVRGPQGPCLHVFHKECLNKWHGDDHPTCPVCRHSVARDRLSDIAVI